AILLRDRRASRQRRKAGACMSRSFGIGKTAIFGVIAGGALLGMTVIRVAAQATPTIGAASAPLPQNVEFNRDIRPLLSDKCFQCHGPGTQFGALRFDSEE